MALSGFPGKRNSSDRFISRAANVYVAEMNNCDVSHLLVSLVVAHFGLFPPTILQTGDTVEDGFTRHVVLAVRHKVAMALELELVVRRTAG